MTITINGSGSITGLSAGGLPDATITQADLASGVAGTGPAFSAYNNASQSISAGTLTKVIFNTEDFDTASCFDSTTNYRFTPNVAGYYCLTAQIRNNQSADVPFWISLYKNGAEIQRGVEFSAPNVAASQLQSTFLVYLNGSTDYVEVYYRVNNAINIGNNDRKYTNLFYGFLARAA